MRLVKTLQDIVLHDVHDVLYLYSDSLRDVDGRSAGGARILFDLADASHRVAFACASWADIEVPRRAVPPPPTCAIADALSLIGSFELPVFRVDSLNCLQDVGRVLRRVRCKVPLVECLPAEGRSQRPSMYLYIQVLLF